MKHIQTYLPPLSIFLLAFLVRIAYNVTAAHGYIPKYDAALYNTIAQNIVTQHCFCRFSHVATVSRAPLWPFVIATIYFFTGPQNAYVRLFYCFLGSGTCVLVYFLARAFFNRRIALLIGLLAAVYTGLFIYDGWLFSESLYTFLLTASVYTLYQLQQTGKWPWMVSSGILLGLASLTRPNGPMLLAFMFLWGLAMIWAKSMSPLKAIRTTLLIICIAIALIAPWTYRNYQVTHAFIPVALGMGDVLAGAYNDTALQNKPDTGPGYWVPRTMITPSPPVRHCTDCFNHDSRNYTIVNEQDDTNYALHWISTHLIDMPYLVAWHFIHMWTPYTLEIALPFKAFPARLSSKIINAIHPIMSFAVFFLAACGLALTWTRKKKQLIVVYLMLALTIVQNLAFYANMRFRAPIEPLLVLLVGGVVWWLTNHKPNIWRNRSQKASATGEPESMLASAGS